MRGKTTNWAIFELVFVIWHSMLVTTIFQCFQHVMHLADYWVVRHFYVTKFKILFVVYLVYIVKNVS